MSPEELKTFLREVKRPKIVRPIVVRSGPNIQTYYDQLTLKPCLFPFSSLYLSCQLASSQQLHKRIVLFHPG